MSREGSLAKNTLIIAIGTFLPKLASVITLPILTGCLTKTEYGMFDLVMVLVSFLLPTVTIQIQSAAFRFLIDVRGNVKEIKLIVSNIFSFITPMSIVALVILFFCLFDQPVIIRIFICLYFFADIMVNAARQICRGLSKNLDYSISAIISAAGKMFFAIVCVFWLKSGFLGSIISLFAASFSSLLYLVLKTKIYQYIDLNYIDKQIIIKMLKYSWPMVPNSMAAWVIRVSNRIVITAFMGVAASAVYSVATKIPGLLNLAQHTFTLAWQENASIVSKDDDAGEYYSTMFYTMFNLMAGFFGILIALTPLLFKILIFGDYTEAYFQIPILFVAMFFFSMAAFLGGIYVAYKESKSVGITTIVAAAINLMLDVGTIQWLGFYAASGSTLVSNMFLFFFRIWDIQKIVKVNYNERHMITIISVMILESILCFQQIFLLNIFNVLLGGTLFFCLNWQLIKNSFSKIRRLLQKRRIRLM